jgi:hypothetical protein
MGGWKREQIFTVLMMITEHFSHQQLEKGADIISVDGDNRTPLSWVAGKGSRHQQF